MAATLYDAIGMDYRRFRRPDPRIAAPIVRALGTATTIVNVGAGSGSYEPRNRLVIAVEPSLAMIRQRPASSAAVVRALAGDLPLRDAAVDASLAVLTLHHWPDWKRGVQELARVARQHVVIFSVDPDTRGFWLVEEYFPEVDAINRRILPTIEQLRGALGRIAVVPVPIPHDCSDGFCGAYWRRPRAYLDASIRGAISIFAELSDVPPRLDRLRDDLASGAWQRRHAELLSLDELPRLPTSRRRRVEAVEALDVFPEQLAARRSAKLRR